MTSINTASDITEGEPSLPASPAFPGLPMQRWPSCFGAPRLSADRSMYEVLLNEEAGSEAGKIWKFHMPNNTESVTKLVDSLKLVSPFSGNPSLQEDLDTLRDYVTGLWIIEDGFSDHALRRDFLDTHEDVALYLKNISKLRKNKMDYLGPAVNLINASLGKAIDSPLRTLIAHTQNYDAADFSGKVALVQEVDRFILSYLGAVHEQLSGDR